MIPPTFSEAKEPRNYTGWIIACVLSLTWLVLALISYFMKASPLEVKVQDIDKKLSEVIHAAPARKASLWRSFDSQVEKAFKKQSPRRYAIFHLVSSFEQNKTVDLSDLNAVKNGPYERHKLLYEIYGNQTFTKEQLKKYQRKLSDMAFVYSVAVVHAYEKTGDRTARTRLLPRNTKPSQRNMLIVGALMLLAMCGGLILLGTYIGFRSTGKLAPLGHPLQAMSLYDADRSMFRASQILLLFFLMSLVPSLLSDVPKEVAALISSLVSVLVLIWLSTTKIWGSKITYQNLGFDRKKLPEHIAWGVAGAIANIPIYLTTFLLSRALFSFLPLVEHSAVGEMRNAINPLMVISIFVGASVQAPILEETLFRGMALPALHRITNRPVLSIIVTSLIFASFHSTGIPSWIPLAGIGAMAAVLTYQTRSIVPAMVMHAVHNGSLLLINLLM